MNGFIEIYVDGWLRYRWKFTLRDYEGFTFQQQVDLRWADIQKITKSLKENVLPNFDPTRTLFQIAYESKLNYHEHLCDENTADTGAGSLAEGLTKCTIGIIFP